MIILSIDSGLEKTGYSIFENRDKKNKYITSGLIETSKEKRYEKRFHEIYLKLNNVIKDHDPKKIILERLFFFRNQKTAISVGQTQGLVILLAAQNNIEIEYLTPLQVKHAVTGDGQADKKSVRKMIELTLKIDKKIKEDDEIDAIACGLAYCYLYR